MSDLDLIKKYLGEAKRTRDWLDENGMLMESRGGWMINMLGDLEEAFNSDAGFYNGNYVDIIKGQPVDQSAMVTVKDHKNLIKALKGLSNAMAKAYKGKLIGF